MVQIHKEFSDSQVKERIGRCLKKELERKYIQGVVDIEKTRFFALFKVYRNDPDTFSIQYRRKTIARKISGSIERNIIKELKIEKDIIQDKDLSLKHYN